LGHVDGVLPVRVLRESGQPAKNDEEDSERDCHRAADETADDGRLEQD
jgi:hypothetical protein